MQKINRIMISAIISGMLWSNAAIAGFITTAYIGFNSTKTGVSH